MNEDARALLARAVAGDRAAWTAVVARYQRLVYATIVDYRIPMPDAEDVFQEVFLRLFRNADHILDRGMIARWIIVVTRRLCVDLGVEAKRLLVLDPSEFDAQTPPLVEASLLRIERQQAVREALGQISGRCRRLLTILYYEQDKPNDTDAARRLKLPVGSIGPTRARCLAQLLRRLRVSGYFRDG